MGLYFPEERLGDLERGIMEAARESGSQSPMEFAGRLSNMDLSRTEIEALAGYITVGETYFFRDQEVFSVLEEKILKDLIELRRKTHKVLRFWSAGCSTGEEPYSLAILLKRILPDIEDWHITILGTDINPRSLKKAQAATYTHWSFRSTPDWLRDRYFARLADGKYQAAPEIRSMVTFEYMNLAEDAYPSLLNNTASMDIIFCRNVLMYFSQDKAARVIRGFHDSLVENGWLLISPAEALRARSQGLEPVNLPGVTMYRKEDGPRLAGPSFPSLERPATVARTRPAPLEPDKVPVQPVADADTGPVKSPGAATDAPSSAGRKDEAAKGPSEAPGPCADEISAVARAYADQGRLDLAAQWCAKAISENMLNPYYHYLFAAVLQEQGRIREAIWAVKKALYLDRDFVIGYFMLGNLLMRNGDPDAGEKNLRVALRLLSSYRPEKELPESEGITAGRLSEIISSMLM